MNRLYREAWDKAGHPKGKWNLAAHYHVVLAENKQEARGIARKAWRRYIEATTHTSERLGKTATGVIAENRRKMMEDLLDTDRMVAELRQIACTPDECVDLLERAQDRMGFTQCDCTFFFGGINFEQAQRSLRLFAKEVMPRLRSREPRLSS
jgi:alkanesulfonate monooxygenase SsuD/methylene tetrahydromethanopterin reductase-like flavin-dependent oxidoreductase (luciferase family)